MSVVLYHVGCPVPQHMLDCIVMIRRRSNIDIHVITDQVAQGELLLADGVAARGACDVSIHHTGDDCFHDLTWLDRLEFWPGDCRRTLWTQSCFRLWYIQRLMEDLNLTGVLHFDNDVLLFDDPERIIGVASRLYSNVTVTSAFWAEIVFGMGYIPNAQALREVNDSVAVELNKGWPYLYQTYSGYPHEMAIMNATASLEFFPVLPEGEDRYANHYDAFGCVFDPSSYGQYLSGYIHDNNPGYTAKYHEIGKHIISGRLKVYMLDGIPVAEYDGRDIRIANLHIHSKFTEPYL